MFRVADGLSEAVAFEVGADVQWFALNLGDGNSWEKYSKLVATAKGNDVLCMPWERVYDPDDLFGLMYAAEQVGFHVLLNIENEFQSDLPPKTVREVIEEFPEMHVGISTVGWIYNDIDLEPLAHLPFLLQCFAQDAHWSPEDIPQKIADCIWHARNDHGLTYVGVTVQTYGDAVPEWYASTEGDVRSYYTGDDMGQGGWAQWKP
jgi:hypothetical protein